MKNKKISILLMFLIGCSCLYSQTAMEILQKSKEKINNISNCKITSTWISFSRSDTTIYTLKDYFQKNDLDTLLGYSFVFDSPNKDNNFKMIYDGCQGIFVNQGKYRIVNDKEKFLSSSFDILLNSRAVISTVLSSDSVEIIQKKDTIINNVKHYVVHIYSPYFINVFSMIVKHDTLKPITEIEFVINSENYLPKILSTKLLYPKLYSEFSATSIFKADSIIEINKMYPNFNYLDFIPKGNVIASHDKKSNLDYKNPPEWKLKTLKGDSISLKSLKGKVVLIDFFSLWCGPCRSATPELIKLKNEFSGKNFEVIGIDNSNKTNIYNLKKYVIEHNANYPFLVNGNEIARSYEIDAIPTFVIINQTGKIAYYKMGFSADIIAEIKTKIENLIE